MAKYAILHKWAEAHRVDLVTQGCTRTGDEFEVVQEYDRLGDAVSDFTQLHSTAEIEDFFGDKFLHLSEYWFCVKSEDFKNNWTLLECSEFVPQLQTLLLTCKNKVYPALVYYTDKEKFPDVEITFDGKIYKGIFVNENEWITHNNVPCELNFLIEEDGSVCELYYADSGDETNCLEHPERLVAVVEIESPWRKKPC